MSEQTAEHQMLYMPPQVQSVRQSAGGQTGRKTGRQSVQCRLAGLTWTTLMPVLVLTPVLTLMQWLLPLRLLLIECGVVAKRSIHRAMRAGLQTRERESSRGPTWQRREHIVL